MSDQNDAAMLAFDAAFAIDDEMQKDIEMEKADPLALTTPSKDGFLPLELIQWARDEDDKYFDEVPEDVQEEAIQNFLDGKRERWVNRERCVVEGTGTQPMTNRETQAVEGIVAYIEFKVQGGPNDGKQFSHRWYVRSNERERARDMNRDLQGFFKKVGKDISIIDLPGGGSAPSATASLSQETLVGSVVEVPIMQKWDFRWSMDETTGKFIAHKDEPKKFKKKVLFDGIKAL